MKPIWVFHIRVGLDAGEDVLCFGVFASDVVRVVRNDHRQVSLVAELDDRLVDLGLIRHVFVHHQFEVVAILENVAVPLEGFVGGIHVAVFYVPGQFA